MPGPPHSSFYHCWRTRLGPVPAAALAGLSGGERARWARFHAAGAQQAYAGAHLFVRAVLGHYVGQPPAALVFGADARHKPALLTTQPLWFNLSYRAQWAVLAVSDAGEVGVDVEEIKPVAGAAALVEQLFSPVEQAALGHCTGAAWWALFYAIWTRKEAWAKLLGMGLNLPFAGFSVAARAAPIAWQVPAPGWLGKFAPDAAHVGALAVRLPPAAGPPVAWQHFTYPHLSPTAAGNLLA